MSEWQWELKDHRVYKNDEIFVTIDETVNSVYAVGILMEELNQLQSELAAANKRVSELEDKVAFLSDLKQRRNNVEIEALQAENARLQAFMESVEYALENSGNHKVAAIEALLDGYKLNKPTPPEPEARYVVLSCGDPFGDMYQVVDLQSIAQIADLFNDIGKAQARADELNASDS